jgi:hypothetical protein
VGAGSDTPGSEDLTGYVLMTPAVRVLANGVGGPLTLGSGQPLDVSFAFDAGEPGFMNPAELFTGLLTPSGLLWVGAGGITTAPSPLYQGPLTSFGPLTLLHFPDVASLPAGTYAWLMVVDADPDGIVGGDFFDFVVTTIVR